MNSNNSELLPAAFHGMTTKYFQEQLRRNLACFPADFVFQLSAEEVRALAGQFVASDTSEHGLLYAFTEHGVLMAAMFLDTPRAMDIGWQVVRAFVQMRNEVSQVLAADKGLALSVVQLERRFQSHDFIVGILETFCDIMKAPGALHLTEAQRAELGRRLDEYENVTRRVCR